CITLGERYVDELEVDGVTGLPTTTPSDCVWARALYDVACDAGNARGCEAFARSVHHSGPRSKPDIALEYSHKSRTLGSAPGFYRLGDFYLGGTRVARDAAAAIGYFQRSCDLGSDAACQRLTGYDLSGFDPASKQERALRACVHGSWYACRNLRDEVRDKGSYAHNRALRREFATIACEDGDKDMCQALGRTTDE
ncbi:MAG: hypothetical protein AAFR93_10195, partial [Pseudomonadota bacterium]